MIYGCNMYFYKTYLNNRLLEYCNRTLTFNICGKEHASYTCTAVLEQTYPLYSHHFHLSLSVKYIVLLYVSIANFIFQLIDVLLPFFRLNNFNSLVTLQFNEEYKFDIISRRQWTFWRGNSIFFLCITSCLITQFSKTFLLLHSSSLLPVCNMSKGSFSKRTSWCSRSISI